MFQERNKPRHGGRLLGYSFRRLSEQEGQSYFPSFNLTARENLINYRPQALESALMIPGAGHKNTLLRLMFLRALRHPKYEDHS